MNQENGFLFILIRGTSIGDGGQYSFSPLLCQWNRFFLAFSKLISNCVEEKRNDKDFLLIVRRS